MLANILQLCVIMSCIRNAKYTVFVYFFLLFGRFRHQDVKWLRKLKPLELFYEIGQRKGTVITAYHATFRSKTKIEEDDMQTALHWLYRFVKY